MFWRKSQASVSDPEELRARLVHAFGAARPGDMFTLDDLVEEVEAERKESVAFILAQLTAVRYIDQVVKVVSPRGGGIADFASVDELPATIFDPFQMVQIEIDPKLIRVFFTKHVESSGLNPVTKSRSHALA